MGTINAIFVVESREFQVTVKNVFYVKEMKQNLMSYAKVTNNNTIISYNNIAEIYNKQNELTAIAQKVNDIYQVKSFMRDQVKIQKINSSQIENKINKKMSLKEKWHRTLGHVNFDYLNTLSKHELLVGMPTNLERETMKCMTCIESKMYNVPFKNDRKQASEILEIIHTQRCPQSCKWTT